MAAAIPTVGQRGAFQGWYYTVGVEYLGPEMRRCDGNANLVAIAPTGHAVTVGCSRNTMVGSVSLEE